MIDPIGLIGLDKGDPSRPQEANCLGYAMTGRTDQFRYPNPKINPNDSFKDAISKADNKWSCSEVTSYANCKCECDNDKMLITLYKKNSTKDPWNDPTFPYVLGAGSPNDIHAIRASSGCSNEYYSVEHYYYNGGMDFRVLDGSLRTLFGGDSALLCCCHSNK